MIVDKVFYGLQGITGRSKQGSTCPSCGSLPGRTIDWKYFHQLLQCSSCDLLFRYPRETEGSMYQFYQSHYRQAGLTTDLPDDEALAHLLRSNFIGSDKDFRGFLSLFDALGLPTGSRILDFGANWGYAMHQFKAAGFSVTGYEISESRAQFGEKLNLRILTDWAEASQEAPFDICFSAHVLEHTPDPAEAIQRQISLLKPGGFLIAVFPHGSGPFREADPNGFHKLWGRVHPVLPTVSFIQNVLPTANWFIGAMTQDDIEQITTWDGMTPTLGNITRSELLVVYRA